MSDQYHNNQQFGSSNMPPMRQYIPRFPYMNFNHIPLFSEMNYTEHTPVKVEFRREDNDIQNEFTSLFNKKEESPEKLSFASIPVESTSLNDVFQSIEANHTSFPSDSFPSAVIQSSVNPNVPTFEVKDNQHYISSKFSSQNPDSHDNELKSAFVKCIAFVSDKDVENSLETTEPIDSKSDAFTETLASVLSSAQLNNSVLSSENSAIADRISEKPPPQNVGIKKSRQNQKQPVTTTTAHSSPGVKVSTVAKKKHTDKKPLESKVDEVLINNQQPKNLANINDSTKSKDIVDKTIPKTSQEKQLLETVPKKAKPFRPSARVSDQKITEQPKQKDLETIKVFEKVILQPQKRKRYLISELVEIQQKEESRKIPDTLKYDEKNKALLRIESSSDRNPQYKRTASGWILEKERFKTLSNVDIKFESFKFEIQRSINRMTKNTAPAIIKDIQKLDYIQDPIPNILIDRIFSAVSTNNSCLQEFAQLLIDFNTFYQKEKKKDITFINEVVRVFTKGSEIPSEWTNRYNSVKNRPINRVEDLDEKNEELQMLERSQRLILNGSVTILGFLFIRRLISSQDSLSIIKRLSTSQSELEIEALVLYLNLIMPIYFKKEKEHTLLVNNIIENMSEIYMKYNLKLRFIAEDLIKLHQNQYSITKKGPSHTSSSVAITSNESILFKPQRDTKSSTMESDKNRFTILAKQNISQKLSHAPKVIEKPVIKSKEQVYRPTNTPKPQETNKHEKIDINSVKDVLFPMFDDFILDYDSVKFICDIKELEVSSHMDIFVNLLFVYLSEHFNVYPLYFGHLLLHCMLSDRLLEKNFSIGMKEFFKNFNNYIEDCPILPSIIASTLTPLFVSRQFTISKLYQILISCSVNTPELCILKCIDSIATYTNIQTLSKIMKTCDPKDSAFSILSADSRYNAQFSYELYVIHSTNDFPNISLDSQLEDKLNQFDSSHLIEFTREFASLIHYCCPTYRDGSDSFISLLSSKYKSVLKFLFEKDITLKSFIHHLKTIFDNAFRHPTDMFRILFTKFLDDQLILNEILRKTVSSFNDDSLNIEFIFIGLS